MESRESLQGTEERTQSSPHIPLHRHEGTYILQQTRVNGHIMICFLALVMETALCRKLKEIGSTFSYAEILEDLTEIRAVEITVENKRFLARTETMGNAYDAFKALKIRPPDLLKEIA